MKSWVILTGILLVFTPVLLGQHPSAEVESSTEEGSAPLVAGRDFHALDAQLAELIDTLLRENPQLRSARAVWRSQAERVAQVGSLPDPMLSYRYFAQTPETRVGPQVQGIELSQGVPWARKRALAARRAEHSAAGASWSVRDVERALVAQLKRAYFDAAYMQEALVVNEQERSLLQRFEEIALTRYATGEGIQQSVIKVQTAISLLEDRRTELRQKFGIVTRRIAQLVGKPRSLISIKPVPLALLKLDYDPGELERVATTDHPGILAVQERLEADRAWERRRLLDGKPDFRFGLGYVDVSRRDDAAGRLNPPENNGQDVLSFTVGLNLPIQRKKIRAGVAETRESRSANEHLLIHTADQLRFGVQEALLDIESLEQRVQLYQDVIIPQANESLASAEAAYSTGRLDFLDLLDAQRVLFQVRLSLHRLLTDYWIALSDLEQNLGRAFPVGGPAR